MSALGPDDRARRLRLRLALVLGLLPALSLLPGLGCTSRLVFMVPHEGGVGDDENPAAKPDAAADRIPVVDTGQDLPVDDRPGDDRNIDPDSGADVPVDRQVDVPADAPRDLTPPPDVPVDVPRDVPRDVPPDVGGGGPVVCTVDAECKLTGLHCLIAAGQPGTCVECVNDTQCPGRRCNTASGINRCVDCLPATVVADCPTMDDSHPSQCTANSFRCLIGCDDSGVACAAGFTCNPTSTLCIQCANNNASCASGICLNMLCVGCATSADCAATPATPTCDFIAGRCVQCRTSKDCTTPGLPLCNPTTLTCVVVPP